MLSSLRGWPKVSFTCSRRFLRTIENSSKLHKAPANQAEPNQTSEGEQYTHYGFETIPISEKAQRVYSVFEGVAAKYDEMNDFMSAGYHRVWKDCFVRQITPIRPGTRILDVAGGTGISL